MKICVLGTGLMGAPMARRLIAGGHDVSVWNRSRARAEAVEGAQVRDTPAEAAAGAEVVLSMLIDGPATRAVLVEAGAMEAAGQGALILDMGSVDPATDIALAEAARALGLRYLDAPVSGGVTGAEAGTLAILVGGSEADFAAAKPVFDLMGRPTLLGPVGAGQVAKLANQLIVATTIGTVAEAFRLAEAAGCDPAKLREALKGGFADSRILDLHGGRMVRGDFVPGGRSVIQLKDLDNALKVAHEHDLDLPLGHTVAEAFRDFVLNHDGAEMDHSAYYVWLERRARTRSGS
ncbi:NAD(P)-dependent oxidoreductase [Limimaricola sp.]|uniref:NAD(P)-dependent oxidoreductase n=1 Tax=Limimaricola sp. TaxID=2211665 RepID=UPI0025BA7F83|nr:NAD(P)-dependent oxidoreductase [Limimaricola sp.]